MSKLIKICGTRSAFFTFLSVILALLIVYGVYANKYYISIICLAFFILLLTFAIKTQNKTLLIVLAITFILFSFYGFYSFNYVNNISIDENYEYCVSGKVPCIIKDNEDYTTFTLENCTIIDNDENEIYSNLNIRVIYSGESYYPEPGDIITFKTTLTKEELFTFGKFNSYNISYGIYFSCFIETENLLIDYNKIKNEKTLKDRICLKVKDAFFSVMDTKSASIAYGVTFGDKSVISSTITNGFKYSGLSHILAVSGLHTSILFMIFTFLMSKLTFINKKVRGVIIAILLLFYAYLCSFSPSIVRAVIMCLLIYFPLVFGYKYDFLNNLGTSGLIILLINPFDIFNVGFCLSFACIYGISLFTHTFNQKFNCIKLQSITSIFAVTLATQIATLPFMANYFGYFTFISFIANVLLLPIFTTIFCIIIVSAIISLIFTPTLMLKLIALCLNSFTEISVYLSSIDYLIVPLCKIGIIGILTYLILLYLCANKFFIKKNTKRILATILVIITLSSCIFVSLPKTPTNQSFCIADTTQTHYFKLDNDNFCLINPFTSPTTIYSTSQTLQNLNEKRINNLIIVDDIYVSQNDMKEF
ncbi:MAG: ComEC/Rec2 family competence protein, partial [Christensenellales bacterium]